MKQSKSEQLLRTYVEVCNQALRENSERFPFKQILGAAKADGMDTAIEVNVVGASEAYVFRVKDIGIEMQRHEECPDCRCVRKWVVQAYFLEQVSKTPEVSVENPAKINWEWMFDAAKLDEEALA